MNILREYALTHAKMIETLGFSNMDKKASTYLPIDHNFYYFSIKDLCSIYELHKNYIKVCEMNVILHKLGLQYRNGRRWSVSDYGKKYINKKSNRNRSIPSHKILWNADVVDLLLPKTLQQ